MTREEYFDFYKTKYPQGIPYETLFDSIAWYSNNIEQVKNDAELFNRFYGFLDYVKSIENSIPTYGSYHGKKDDHTNWVTRTFRLFGRAFLEETAVLNSDFARENSLVFNQPEKTKHNLFHPGPGDSISDLISTKTNKTYDVKHGEFSWSESHKADFILKYTNSGFVEVHDTTLQGSSTGTFVGYFECPSVKDLAISVDLPPMFIGQLNTEQELQEFLGVN